MNKLIILDFITGDVDIYPVEFDYEKDVDVLFHDLGHNANDCQWMISDGKITFHKEALK